MWQYYPLLLKNVPFMNYRWYKKQNAIHGKGVSDSFAMIAILE
jgi:hypothetical protein